MPTERKTFGTGIEHEFIMFKDNGNSFSELSDVNTPRGGYHDSSWVYSSNDTIERGYGLSEGQKLVVVGSDPTVGRRGRGGGYEIATMGWKNKKIEDQVKKIRKCEEYIIKKNQEAHPRNRVRYMPFGSYGTDTASGPGSYHIHFTLPHLPTDSTRTQLLRVKKWIGNIQWIEPLIISATHGISPSSVGDEGKEPEGSIRLARNSYGNPGGTNIAELPGRFSGRSGDDNFSSYTDGHWSRLMKISRPGRKSRIGDIVLSGDGRRGPAVMEARFPDQFDSRALEGFIKAMVYAGANGVDNNNDVTKIAGTTPEWNKAMAKVVEEGWNAYLPEKYVKEMRNQLKLPARRGKSLRAIDVMEETVKELWEKNKDGETANYFLKDTRTAPKIYNVNRDSWAFFMKHTLRTHPDVREKFKKLLEDLTDTDTSSSGGYVNAGKYDDTKKGMIHLVHKHLGRGYSAEDVRDILDFMEYEGLIRLKRNEDGSIDKFKVLYDKNQLDSKYDAIVKDVRFFKDEPVPTMFNPRVMTQRSAGTGTGTTGGRRRRGFHIGRQVRIRRNADLSALWRSSERELAERMRDSRAIGTVRYRGRGFTRRRDAALINVRFGDEGNTTVAYNHLEYADTTPRPRRPSRPRPSQPRPSSTTTGTGMSIGSWVKIKSNIPSVVLTTDAQAMQTGRVPGMIQDINTTSQTARVNFGTHEVGGSPIILDLALSHLEVSEARQREPVQRDERFDVGDWVVVVRGDNIIRRPGKVESRTARNIGTPTNTRFAYKYKVKWFALSDEELEATRNMSIVRRSVPDRWAVIEFPHNDLRQATTTEVYNEEQRIGRVFRTRDRAQQQQAATSEDINAVPIRQIARRMSQLKTLVGVFLRARSSTDQERSTLGWINDYRVSITNSSLRSDYTRALYQYTRAKEARRERTGRRQGRASFGRPGRQYKSREGPGWFVKGDDEQIKRVEIVRHKIAAIKGHKKRKRKNGKRMA